ncbi:hypothetical protein JCGZ_15447 [Jatropha curcas]|uniref:Secreted protein n=1 Tax=Jatropha curcas TaxID=180498 RepID=A0A067KGV0_JATCU|nr:hypothetical protein JCGZ_15447 [Jatropha curcas]
MVVWLSLSPFSFFCFRLAEQRGDYDCDCCNRTVHPSSLLASPAKPAKEQPVELSHSLQRLHRSQFSSALINLPLAGLILIVKTVSSPFN